MIVPCLYNHRGTTLIEQLVSLVIGSVVMTCLYGYFRAELYHVLAVEAKTATLEDARGAMDIIMRDLKNAGSWGSGTVPSEVGSSDDPNNDPDTVCNRVYAASPSLIHVQMDLNGNGNCEDNDPQENIRYELTGPTTTCPSPNILRRNGDCLIANIVPATAGKIFSYYDANGTELGNVPPLNTIKRVKVSFTVRVKNPDPKVAANLASVLSSSIEFRN